MQENICIVLYVKWNIKLRKDSFLLSYGLPSLRSVFQVCAYIGDILSSGRTKIAQKILLRIQQQKWRYYYKKRDGSTVGFHCQLLKYLQYVLVNFKTRYKHLGHNQQFQPHYTASKVLPKKGNKLIAISLSLMIIGVETRLQTEIRRSSVQVNQSISMNFVDTKPAETIQSDQNGWKEIRTDKKKGKFKLCKAIYAPTFQVV